MPLLSVLGLPLPVGAAAAGAAALAAAKRTGGAGTGATKPADGQVNGETKPLVTAGEPVVIASRRLGTLKWDRHVAKIWALSGIDGAIVRRGSTWQLRDLAAMNGLGDQAIHLIEGLAAHEKRWREAYAKVRAADAGAAVDVKKVALALPAMAKRMKSDKDFFGDVNGYLVALEAAENAVIPIRIAKKKFDEATLRVQVAVFDMEAFKGQDKVDESEKAVAAKEAEIAEAKRIFGVVLDVAVIVAKQDWEGLALKAIEYVGEKVIDDMYATDLATLQQRLDVAKGELHAAKQGSVLSKLEAERAAVEAAALAYEQANKLFKTALDQLARVKANASNELKESGSTAVFAKMIAGRTVQLGFVASARSLCTSYVSDAKSAIDRVQSISFEYGKVGSWLDAAAKDPVYARDQVYAVQLESNGLSNAVELGKWIPWGQHILDQCREALAWVADEGPKGPLGHFDRAKELTKQGLTVST